VIQQAQHFFIRKCTECVLDTIAKEIKDPLITTHWNALNSPMQSCVKINIIAHGYDTVCRTSLLLHVADKSLKCITRDGRVVQMSYEMQELRDFMYCQVIFYLSYSNLLLSKLRFCCLIEDLPASNDSRAEFSKVHGLAVFGQ
jgi:hypothetical protein